jgi:hypothetical protein
VLLYAAAGAFAFEIFLPVGLRLAGKAPLVVAYQPWFVLSVCVVVVLVMSFVVAEPIRIRRDHWQRVHRYPPLWFAPALAFLGALLIAALPPPYQPLRNAPDWEHVWLVVTIVGAFVVAVATRQIPWQKRTIPRNIVDAAAVVEWNTLSTWFATEGPTQQDLFGHGAISARIANTLLDQSCEQAIALLGPFGSGKSSILARVRATLEDADDPFFIVAEFNGWAIPQAADAPRVALERIIDALGRFVDMQQFRGLSESYKRLVAAEPSGLLGKLLGTSSDGEPLVHLKRLETVLEALNARVILFVEDADRAGNRVESRHLERLLTTLRDVSRVSFVLSIDGTRGPQFDYRKLCDTIEIVPKLQAEYVLQILRLAYLQWMSEPFVDPRPKKESALGLDQEPNELLEYYRRTAKDGPADAITTLLQSPRRLKHLIRRVDRVWRNLRGEVDLDDLIIVSTLRDLDDRAVFEFLTDNIDAARQNSD